MQVAFITDNRGTTMKHDIDKHVAEYNDNKCRFCAYYRKHGGRCCECEDHNWFIQEISLLDFVIKKLLKTQRKNLLHLKEQEK